MSKQDRMEKIRKARSLNDLMDVVQDIRGEATAGSKTTRNLFRATASIIDESKIVVIRGDGDYTPGRVSTKGKQKISFGEKLKDFAAPSKVTVDKHVGVIEKLHGNARDLEAVEAMLRQQFSGIKNSKAALDAIVELKDSINESIYKAMESLNKMAEKHTPKQILALRDALEGHLIDTLPEDTYDNIGTLDFINTTENGETVFSSHIQIDNLKNSHGYMFDVYYIILTGVVNKAGAVAYFVNALPDEQVPGKYPLGKQISSGDELKHRVEFLLSHNDILTELERAPMHVAHDELSRRGFDKIVGLKGAKIANDALTVEFEKGLKPAVRTEAIKRIIALLNAAVSRKKTTEVAHKAFTKAGKEFVEFILYIKPTGGKGTTHINLERFNEIAEIFDLSDGQKTALRRSLID